MNESRWIYEFIGLAAFFNGILFLWLKWDVKELKRSLDGHIDYHLIKKRNGKGR